MTTQSKIALAFAALSAEQRAGNAALSFAEMGKAMAEIKGIGKQSKALKSKVNTLTINAHAHNIAVLVLLDLVDPEYGNPDHRNTTTGPKYMADLQEQGFSEAKAKLFWEYGQLALKEPEGLAGITEAAMVGPKGVANFLKKLDIDTEAALKKIVQPVKADPAKMVDKITQGLSDDEFDACIEEVMTLRQARKDQAGANVAAAVQPSAEKLAA